jgi:UDP-N-acetylmuramoyl-L-alanyl-D-glutamate--2,6-diaminopimelate ligase
VRAPDAWPEITGITEDSRALTAGGLFCAVQGSQQDGHRYLGEAHRLGAAAAVVTRPEDLPLPQVVVRDSRAAVAIVAAEWHGRPAASLRIIGVTGTNGKSTTVALIRHLLNDRRDVGSIGTLGAFDGTGEALPDTGLTTPGAVTLHATLAQLVRRGGRTVVMEASSHALDQHRLDGLSLAAGVYTNLTHDHLDYHGDLSSYFAAKALLSTLIARDGVEVVNLDAPAWKALASRPGLRRLTFGVSDGADVRAADISPGAQGTKFRIITQAGRASVDLPLLGDFNVSNALAASATAIGLGMPLDQAARRLGSAPQVPGRLERLVTEPFTVLRDYAHTPDALARAIAAVKPITPGRVIVLFGAGGDRDKRKRPEMGRIVAREADLAIVTSDNPRTESPDRIMDEIEAGMDGTAHIRLVDRREAIARALRIAEPGDCVLLAGKGHETYQVIGTQRIPFDEREIVLGLVAGSGTT